MHPMAASRVFPTAGAMAKVLFFLGHCVATPLALRDPTAGVSTPVNLGDALGVKYGTLLIETLLDARARKFADVLAE